MNSKNTIVGIVVAVLLAIGAFFGFSSTPEPTVQGVSQPGISGSSAKLYTSTVAPATISATTTSILNTDGTDRGIIYGITSCTSVGSSEVITVGGGLAALKLRVATGTTAVDAKGNAAYAFDMTIATSSPWQEQFVTSPSNGAVSFVWPTGTYLNFTFNATNTAACTVGVGTVSL